MEWKRALGNTHKVASSTDVAVREIHILLNLPNLFLCRLSKAPPQTSHQHSRALIVKATPEVEFAQIHTWEDA